MILLSQLFLAYIMSIKFINLVFFKQIIVMTFILERALLFFLMPIIPTFLCFLLFYPYFFCGSVHVLGKPAKDEGRFCFDEASLLFSIYIFSVKRS